MLEATIYDFLFTQRIDSNIKALIGNALGNHFPSLEAIWLIQRWHPHNVAWAENWTDLVFEFLKPLSRTHLLTNGEINGSAYGFEPEYTADLPEELNLPTFPDELTVKVKKGKTGSISWIERSHEVVKAPYCERLTNEITCWHRSQQVISAKNEDVEVKVNSSQMLINSVVLQEAELVGLSNPQKELILYEFLDKSLEEIYDQLNISECLILTRFDVSMEIQTAIYSLWGNFSGGGTPHQVTISDFDASYFNPLFQPVPSWYYFVTLQKENEVIGKKIEYLLEGGRLKILFSENKLNDLPPVFLDTSIEDLTDPFLFYPFSENTLIQEKEGLKKYRTKINKPMGYFVPSPMPWFTDWDNATTEVGTPCKDVFGSSEGILLVDSFPDLFKKSQELFFYSGFYALRSWLAADSVSHPITNSLSAVKGLVTVSRLFTGDQEANIVFGYEKYLIGTKDFSNSTYCDWFEYPQYWEGIANPYLIQQTTTITREFWDAAPESNQNYLPDSVLEALNSPYIEGHNNDVSITIENTTINFTRPFFDPDPDNGDIMPDSKRIIEIHSALQADKYGNDETDPNAARVANLGWLIEKIGHVLGLHFKSDGAMVKIPNTKWVKLGDTIPEEYQIEQWGKNDWTNSDKETAKGVGLAYEVNSNYFGKDKFGKQTIEEGGYVLVHSLPQLIEIIGDDLDRALGWQDLGANVLPKADGTGYITYQGLHSLLMEVAYMLSAMSINTQHAHTLGLKNNAILQELLGAIGLPVELKTIPVKLMGQDAKIPYPGFAKEGASLVDFFTWILSNQALTTASHISVKEKE